MTVPVTAARQATFCTDPADTVSEKSIRKGNIELPVIDDSLVLSGVRRGNHLSSAESSSPIYGSKSALQRFKDECRKTAVKPVSVVDDSSELDILSDVGLAGDSDSEVVPVVTPLSLSARAKIRKEPRIKVPSSKLDNTEPTIQEETTQDVLATNTPVRDVTENRVVHNVDAQIRSETIVVNKNTKIREDIEENDSENKSSSQEPRSVKETVKNNTEINHKAHSNKKAKNVEDPNTLNRKTPDIEPESSFYESDWQPKKGKEFEDKSVISRKYDSEIKPKLTPSFNVKKSDSPVRKLKKRPRSSGDGTVTRSDKPCLSDRTPDNDKPAKKVSFDKNAKSVERLNAHSRPKSAEFHPSQTPQISDFNTSVQKLTPGRGGLWGDKNERVSGIPKRGANSNLTPRSKLKAEISQSKTPRIADISDNMATSDAYDYESETFEEVLQERNAMVKAERTYQRRIKQLEEELKGMINQCQALSDENKELRKNIDSLKKKNEDDAKTVENGDDTVALAARIAKLETEKENLVKENVKLSLGLKDNDNKKKQSDIVFVENTKLKNKNSELEKKVAALENKLESMSQKLKDLEEDKTGKASVMEFKQREYEVALAEVKNENKNLTVKVTSLEKDKKVLTNTLEEKRTELNEVLRAMQNETATESELKYSKERLENAQSEIDSVKKELDDMKRSLQESETNKNKLRNVVSQREAELKRIKSDQEHKDRVIVDLRHSLDKARDEIRQSEERESNRKELEKETNALKSRIGSLKAEIESSLQENQRLKYDREEASYELNRLRNENVAASEAISDSRRYFRKWEQERDARNKAEVELAKKQEEVDALDSRVKDSGNKINILCTRLRALEDDRARYKGPNAQELETDNKVLNEENKKLRQMLVERNIELVNKQNEKEVMHSRIDVLEKKQKDAEVRVRQLSGWVSSIDGDSQSSARDGHNSNRDRKEHLPPRNPKGLPHKNSSRQHGDPSHTSSSQNRFGEPQIAFVSPRSRKKGVKRNAHHTMTPPPGWEKSRDNAELENSNHTPLSLPLIHDSKSVTPPDHNGGYFTMYKERLKRMKDRRF